MFLGIAIGTSSVKALLVDENEKVVAQASSPAGSGGVSPRESNPMVHPRSETLREPAAGMAALRG